MIVATAKAPIVPFPSSSSHLIDSKFVLIQPIGLLQFACKIEALIYKI